VIALGAVSTRSSPLRPFTTAILPETVKWP
jgi:hypothetical protein